MMTGDLARNRCRTFRDQGHTAHRPCDHPFTCVETVGLPGVVRCFRCGNTLSSGNELGGSRRMCLRDRSGCRAHSRRELRSMVCRPDILLKRLLSACCRARVPQSYSLWNRRARPLLDAPLSPVYKGLAARQARAYSFTPRHQQRLRALRVWSRSNRGTGAARTMLCTVRAIRRTMTLCADLGHDSRSDVVQ